MSNKIVLVVCGAGTLTSVVATQGIEEGLQKRGVKGVKIVTGRMDDIARYRERIAVLVTTMNVRESYEFPVLNAISFLTGDVSGQEKIINKIGNILIERGEK